MNIFYLASDPRIKLNAQAGSSTHIKKTIDAFMDAGHNVMTVISGEIGNVEAKKRAHRALKRNMPYVLSRFISEIHEIVHDRFLFKYCSRKIDKAGQVSFVYERTSPFHIAGLRLSKKYGMPLILEVNDPLFELLKFYPSVLKGYLLRLEDRLLEESHGIIVGSKRLKSYLVNRGVKVSKIEVVYPTADYKVFSPNGPATILEKHKVPENSIIIGHVGSMRPWHKVDILIDAMAKTIRQLGTVTLLILGDGPEKGQLVEMTNRLGIERKVAFLGSVNYQMVPAYIKVMDVCVIPYATWYGSPTKLFEYGAMAKPVIGPRNTPVDEIIDDASLGSLVELGTPEELASTILRLIRNLGIAKEMGRNLHTKLTKEITWDNNVKIICNLL